MLYTGQKWQTADRVTHNERERLQYPNQYPEKNAPTFHVYKY